MVLVKQIIKLIVLVSFIFIFSPLCSAYTIENVGNLSVQGYHSAGIDGNYIYLTTPNHNALRVLNISNDTGPILSDSVGLNRVCGLDYYGNYVYVSGGTQDDGYFYIIDVLNKTNISIVNTSSSYDGSERDVYCVNDNYVFERISWSDGFHINKLYLWDVSDKYNPVINKSWTLESGGATNSGRLCGFSDYLFVSECYSSEFLLYDITNNPVNTTLLSTQYTPTNRITHIEVVDGGNIAGKYVYVGSVEPAPNDGYLDIIMMINGTNSVLLDTHTFSGGALQTIPSVEATENYMYVYNSGLLYVFDISDKENMSIITTKNLDGGTYGGVIVDDSNEYVYTYNNNGDGIFRVWKVNAKKLTGYVNNSRGDSVANATISLDNSGGSTTSNSTGYYQITGITSGTYTITATATKNEDYSDTVSITTYTERNITMIRLTPALSNVGIVDSSENSLTIAWTENIVTDSVRIYKDSETNHISTVSTTYGYLDTYTVGNLAADTGYNFWLEPWDGSVSGIKYYVTGTTDGDGGGGGGGDPTPTATGTPGPTAPPYTNYTDEDWLNLTRYEQEYILFEHDQLNITIGTYTPKAVNLSFWYLILFLGICSTAYGSQKKNGEVLFTCGLVAVVISMIKLGLF